jgi:competence protein ComEC
MAGLLLGSRKGIPDYLMQKFNITGLTHIIAISGYNITLVIVIIGGIFGFLSRKLKVVFSILFVFIFTVTVGASAAVVRAAIMGIISLISIWYGRTYFVVLGLFCAAFFMNLWNPKILVYDVGFQLSFLATFGLIFLSDGLKKYVKFLPEMFAIRESFAMTLSAQVFALPIILLNFGRLSLISPIANVFVLPFIPFAMFFGFFGVFFGYFSDILGNLVGFIGYLILKFIIGLVDFFASLKYASISLDFICWWMVGLYFYVLAKRFFK